MRRGLQGTLNPVRSKFDTSSEQYRPAPIRAPSAVVDLEAESEGSSDSGADSAGSLADFVRPDAEIMERESRAKRFKPDPVINDESDASDELSVDSPVPPPPQGKRYPPRTRKAPPEPYFDMENYQKALKKEAKMMERETKLAQKEEKMMMREMQMAQKQSKSKKSNDEYDPNKYLEFLAQQEAQQYEQQRPSKKMKHQVVESSSEEGELSE